MDPPRGCAQRRRLHHGAIERDRAAVARAVGRRCGVVAFDRGGDFAIKAMGEAVGIDPRHTQLLGGDKKGAALEYYRAQEFSQKTDFSSLQIEQAQARLMAQGSATKTCHATLFSAADLPPSCLATKPDPERVTMALAQISGKGQLQGES